MKELTTYSLVGFERRSHGPTSGMFLEFQFAENPGAILETLCEDTRLNEISKETTRMVAQAQLREQS